MAERGAHLTGTTYVKPTIFEIVAQESLALTLEPAFKKIFTFLISCNPERYGWLYQWSDEAYATFHGILQNFYLKNYAGSFSEIFYGLKRINLINSTTRSKLTRKQQYLSLILLVLYPYIKSKVQQYELNKIDGKISAKKWQRCMSTFLIKSHKILQFLYKTFGIYYYLAYITDYSPYPSPMFRLLSSTLTYSHPVEFTSVSELLHKWKEGNFCANDGINLIQRGCIRSLEFGAFFLQFINWWNAENYHTSFLSLPLPPPPLVPDTAKQYKKLCPICLKTPNIPTALSVSGYVFCYPCIFMRIQRDGKCPVTHYPAKEDDLIRIYK